MFKFLFLFLYYRRLVQCLIWKIFSRPSSIEILLHFIPQKTSLRLWPTKLLLSVGNLFNAFLQQQTDSKSSAHRRPVPGRQSIKDLFRAYFLQKAYSFYRRHTVPCLQEKYLSTENLYKFVILQKNCSMPFLYRKPDRCLLAMKVPIKVFSIQPG